MKDQNVFHFRHCNTKVVNVDLCECYEALDIGKHVIKVNSKTNFESFSKNLIVSPICKVLLSRNEVYLTLYYLFLSCTVACNKAFWFLFREHDLVEEFGEIFM